MMLVPDWEKIEGLYTNAQVPVLVEILKLMKIGFTPERLSNSKFWEFFTEDKPISFGHKQDQSKENG